MVVRYLKRPFGNNHMVEVTLDPNTRFEKALVRLIRDFNYLDTNVGLCIAHLLYPSDPTKAYSALARMTAEKRIARLEQLLDDRDIKVSKKVRSQLIAWYEDAALVRGIRNRYVHGNWEFLPLRHDKPVGVFAPPWMSEQLGVLAHETMDLAQLELIADKVKAVLNEFMRLRRQLGV